MLLIGINGFRRSGKNTTGNIIAGLLGSPKSGHLRVKQVGFADKLKVLGALSLGFKGNEVELIKQMDAFKEDWLVDVGQTQNINDGVPDMTLSGRQYLQNLGNQARNVFGEEFWIDQVLPNPFFTDGFQDRATVLQECYFDVDCLVVTDVRYLNEAKRIKALGGTMWRVNRPGIESDGHASEQVLPDELIDREIDNSKGLLDLMTEVSDALSHVAVS